MFTYWDGPKWYPERWNEIDIEIVPSVEQSPLSTNLIFGDGEFREERHVYTPNFYPADEWHVYEVQWHPQYIKWLVDGKEVRMTTQWDKATKFLNQKQVLMMNLWIPQFPDWAAGFEDSDMPYEAQYDYVETYSYNKKSDSFDLHWRDDFDYFDEGKWERSDNQGFTDNGVTFFKSQAFVEDGHLTLRLQKPEIKEKVVQYYDIPGEAPIPVSLKAKKPRGERHPARYGTKYDPQKYGSRYRDSVDGQKEKSTDPQYSQPLPQESYILDETKVHHAGDPDPEDEHITDSPYPHHDEDLEHDYKGYWAQHQYDHGYGYHETGVDAHHAEYHGEYPKYQDREYLGREHQPDHPSEEPFYHYDWLQ